MGIFVPIPPHQAELQEVVGEEEAEDANSFSSPSPSVTAKSLAGTTPESSSLQVQHTQLISAPLKDLTKLIMQSVTGNVFDLLVQLMLTFLEMTCLLHQSIFKTVEWTSQLKQQMNLSRSFSLLLSPRENTVTRILNHISQL